MAKKLPPAFLANQKKKGSAAPAPTSKTHAGKGKTMKAMPGRKGSTKGSSRGSSRGSSY